MQDDEELVEISAEELASLRLQVDPVPAARGWSTPTFACHYNWSSCLLSCCCPCVQFGLNQRSAFGASCFKWVLLWLLPLVLLYVAIDQLVAPAEAATAEGAVQHVLAEGEVAEVVLDRSAAFMYAVPIGMALIGLVGMLRRRALRVKYGIGMPASRSPAASLCCVDATSGAAPRAGGSAIGDFVCHCCCTCCSLAKEAREIRRQILDEVVAGAEQDIHEVAIP